MPPKTANKPFSTRLPDDVRAALQAFARSKGLTESGLGRMFLDGLAGATGGAPEGRALVALVIAALSDTIDFDQAKKLVAQHLAPEPRCRRD